jgi:hypothetical protein
LTLCFDSLDDSIDRHCDYLIAINFFTAYLLQLIGRLKESLNFIAVAERMLQKLLLVLRPENKPSISKLSSAREHHRGATKLGSTAGTLALIDEEQPGSPGSNTATCYDVNLAKGRSRMTKTLLSNYLLGISLLKNIAYKFTNPTGYHGDSMASIAKIIEIESRYGLNS